VGVVGGVECSALKVERSESDEAAILATLALDMEYDVSLASSFLLAPANRP